MDKNLDLQKELSDHLNRISIFEALWSLHLRWTKGILIKEILATGSANIHLGYTKDTYYNFAIPAIEIPQHLDIDLIKKELDLVNNNAGFYLLEDHRKQGFIEHLLRNGFRKEEQEAWLLFNPSFVCDYDSNFEIVEITPETFDDYYNVLIDVLSDYEHKEEYLEIHKRVFSRGIDSEISDLDSKLYVIYENDIPVAGAGMFYSVVENFAYLHTAGTKKEYRKKGYQSELIKFRVETAQSMGITRLYSQTSHGTTAWSNLIKNGFHQLHIGEYYLR